MKKSSKNIHDFSHTKPNMIGRIKQVKEKYQYLQKRNKVVMFPKKQLSRNHPRIK